MEGAPPEGPDPYGQQGYGQQPPPYAQPPYQQQPPPYQQPYGYDQQQQAWQQQPYPYYQQQALDPGNTPAVVSLVLGICSIAGVVFFLGLIFPITLGMGIPAIFLGRNGMKKVDQGETAKHRGLAQAGFITGIIGTVLSAISALFWILVFVGIASSDSDSNNNDLFDETYAPALQIAGAAVRAAALIG